METLRNFAHRAKTFISEPTIGEGIAAACMAALLSVFSLGDGFAPLGTAFLTAVWCSPLNPYFAALGAVLGSVLAGCYAQAAACGLITAAVFITSNRGRLHNAYKYLIMVGCIVALYPLSGVLINEDVLSFSGAAVYFGETCLTLLISLIMTHALAGIQTLRRKQLLSDEQLLTVALLGGMAALSFGNLRILGVSPGAVFTALVCMYCAYAKGIAGVACAAAVACGRVFGCGGDLLLVAVLCSCTLLSACTRMFGRWGVCGGFAFPSLVFAGLINGTGALTIAETLIAGAIFVITPRAFLEVLDYNSASKRTEQMQLRLDRLTDRLASLSRVIGEMSGLFDDTDEADDGFVHRQLAGVSDSLRRLVRDDGRRIRKSFFVDIGCASCPKFGNKEAGDSMSVREIDGRFMAAISDGMGSGHAARRESAQTLELMYDLMSVGFRLDEAAECANRLLMLREKGEKGDGGEDNEAGKKEEGCEMYATLDAMLLDPTAGLMSLAKHGAPPSYLLRGGKLSTLYAEALPVGIITEARPAVCNVSMKRGDIVIMMSDGVSDALGSELVAAVTERALSAANANEAAASLLDAARRNGRNRDDMSVIVAKIA